MTVIPFAASTENRSLSGAGHSWRRRLPIASRPVETADPQRDTALPGYALYAPDATLVGYRPGEQATLRHQTDDGVEYIKIVKPRRAARLAQRWLRAANLVPSNDTLRVPRVTWFDNAGGCLAFTEVPGRSLYDAIAGHHNPNIAIRSAAAAIVALQQYPTYRAPTTGGHDLQGWLQDVHDRDPRPDARLHRLLDEALATMATPSHLSSVLVHGHLDDRAVLIDSPPGLLDIDSVRLGPPAEDVGNLAAHLVVRRLQGMDTGPLLPLLVTAYSDLGGKALDDDIENEKRRALLRLACMARFRPQQAHLSKPLAMRAMGIF